MTRLPSESRTWPPVRQHAKHPTSAPSATVLTARRVHRTLTTVADIKQKWPWPANVGVLGTYPEEVKARARLEKNPDASPMPAAAPGKLLTPKQSSDDLRMGEPAPFNPDPAEMMALDLNHVVLRRILMKRKRKSWGLFGDAVEAEGLDDLPGTRRDQMKAMLRREEAMLRLLDRYNGMAEAVYSRLLAESKG